MIYNRRYEKAVVIITHNETIAKIADRVFHFKDGELVKVQVNEDPAKPEELEW